MLRFSLSVCILLLLGSIVPLEAQNQPNTFLRGRVEGLGSTEVRAELFNNPVSFHQLLAEGTVGPDGTFAIAFHLEKPSPVWFQIGGKMRFIFLYPGETFDIQASSEDFLTGVQIAGPNAARLKAEWQLGRRPTWFTDNQADSANFEALSRQMEVRPFMDFVARSVRREHDRIKMALGASAVAFPEFYAYNLCYQTNRVLFPGLADLSNCFDFNTLTSDELEQWLAQFDINRPATQQYREQVLVHHTRLRIHYLLQNGRELDCAVNEQLNPEAIALADRLGIPAPAREALAFSAFNELRATNPDAATRYGLDLAQRTSIPELKALIEKRMAEMQPSFSK